MNTLLLDRTIWDVCLDSSGNIALASPPYAIAQDVASAVRLFLGEAYYDTTQGVPYFSQILGHLPPLTLMKAQFVAAALTVPGVVSAVCFISEITGRKVSGQIQVTDSAGVVTNVSF